jgi:hypothetical protein
MAPILLALEEHPHMFDLIKHKFSNTKDIELVSLSGPCKSV